MSKSLLTILTALGISALSSALIFGRWYTLGAEIDGTPGTSAWRVQLRVDGHLLAGNGRIKLVLPPDFRHQHVIDEHFQSGELSHKMRHSKDGKARTVTWTSRVIGKFPVPFHLIYSFRTINGMRRPTPGMNQRSKVLDAAPVDGRDLKPGALIESDHEAIAALAKDLARPGLDQEDQLRVWFEYVARLGQGEPASALECLQKGAGSDAGKARLLVALCRNQDVPARIVVGLQTSPGAQRLHYWTEAFVVNRWIAVDPDEHRIGSEVSADDYVMLGFGEDPLQLEASRGICQWRVTRADSLRPDDEGNPPSLARLAWRRMSLANLRPEEQAWMKFLVLLPLAALVVSFFRTVIGITTFGTFGPALLGLVCRDLRDFPWALGAFVCIMLIGWWLRRLLDHFHLLMVPRISVILTAIVILLIAAAMLFQPYATTARGYIALLPLIILTHMIERFWTVETEDGPAESFRTLLGTVVVAVAIALVINIDVLVNACARLFGVSNLAPPDFVRTLFFRYPEALGLCLAGQLLLGRYTGYRLTELWRFQDLLLPPSHSGDENDAADAGTPPEGAGHSGHESP